MFNGHSGHHPSRQCIECLTWLRSSKRSSAPLTLLWFGSSQPRSRASAIRSAKSLVSVGAEVKFGAGSKRVGFPSGGVGRSVSFQSFYTCGGLHSSRTLTSMPSHMIAIRTMRFCSSWVQSCRRQRQMPTPNPSIKRTVKGLRPSPAAYVKRWASQGTCL